MRVVGFIIIMGLAIVWAVSLYGLLSALPLAIYLHPDLPWINYMAAFNILAILGTVLVGIAFFVARLTYGYRSSRPWNLGLLAFLILNFLSLCAYGVYTASQFSHISSKELPSQVQLTDGHLEVRILPEKDPGMTLFGGIEVNIGDWGMSKNYLTNDMVTLSVYPAKSQKPDLRVERSSQGRDQQEADALIDRMNWEPEGHQPGLLQLPRYIRIPHGDKFRGQRVDAALYLPEGATVRFGKQVQPLLRCNDVTGLCRQLRSNPQARWQMKGGQLHCLDCTVSDNTDQAVSSLSTIQTPSQDKAPALAPFSEIIIAGNLHVDIRHSDQHLLRLNGPDQFAEQVNWSIVDSALVLKAPLTTPHRPMWAYIHLPELQQLELSHTRDVHLTDLDQAAMTIISTGEQRIKADGRVDQLTVELQGATELDLYGQIQQLTANLFDTSRLDADHASIGQVNIQAEDRSRVVIKEHESLRQQVAPDAHLRVRD